MAEMPLAGPRTQAFFDLKTWKQVEVAAPWAQAIIRVNGGPCRGVFFAFERPDEAQAWAKQAEADA